MQNPNHPKQVIKEKEVEKESQKNVKELME